MLTWYLTRSLYSLQNNNHNHYHRWPLLLLQTGGQTNPFQEPKKHYSTPFQFLPHLLYRIHVLPLHPQLFSRIPGSFYGKFRVTILYFKTEFIFTTNHPATGLKEFLDPQNFKVAKFKKKKHAKWICKSIHAKCFNKSFHQILSIPISMQN